MNPTDADTRGALTGAIIAAAFALAWAMWGATGLSSSAAAATRIAAGVAAVALIGRAALLRRSKLGDAQEGSMFSSPAYRWIVAVEITALFGGAVAGAITGLAGGPNGGA